MRDRSKSVGCLRSSGACRSAELGADERPIDVEEFELANRLGADHRLGDAVTLEITKPCAQSCGSETVRAKAADICREFRPLGNALEAAHELHQHQFARIGTAQIAADRMDTAPLERGHISYLERHARDDAAAMAPQRRQQLDEPRMWNAVGDPDHLEDEKLCRGAAGTLRQSLDIAAPRRAGGQRLELDRQEQQQLAAVPRHGGEFLENPPQQQKIRVRDAAGRLAVRFSAVRFRAPDGCATIGREHA